ncbi:LANO_0H13212g1_1 [Lachancea nothofagi CBS 11611]|uniref:LANO_0H13212g1_1 n=1 Tax=Lachancea nothofagi CBS 11611 TaxID=1266666 RepID=A0A1G4KMF4_9SACH|nr:LANO_0H13212g1_1 [Lachancea nothofagi CBS 11611]
MDETAPLSADSIKLLAPTLINFNDNLKGQSELVVEETTDEDIPKSYHHIVEIHQRSIEQQLRPLVTYTGDSDSKRKLGQFTLVRRIGKGQYGDVYMAKSAIGEHVAVKCISKRPKKPQQYSMNQVMRQMRRQKSLGRRSMSSDEAIIEMNMNKIRWEIFVASRLKHGNVLEIVQCLDSPMSQEIWIVSPWATLGELKWKRRSKLDTLEQWDVVLQHKTNTIEFAEYVLRSLCDGLLYLSEQGCVHRDIKPSNILVNGQNGRVMLSDFGSCVLLPNKLPFKDTRIKPAYQEELHKIAGTPAFTAPELCNFEEQDVNIDGFQLDVWALGITIYCLLENSLPFWGENEFDTFQKIVSNKLSHRGDWLHEVVVSKLLHKDPLQRIKINELYALLQNPKKETGVRRFVSKLRKLSMKSKKKDKCSNDRQSDQVPTAPEIEFSDIDSDLSFAGSSFDEPVQIPGFMAADTKTTTAEVDTDSHASHEETNPSLSEPSYQDATSTPPRLKLTHEHNTRDTSPSPIKIDTPLKNLIRTQNTPESQRISKSAETPNSKLRSKANAQHNPQHNNTNILASRGTLDFKKYFNSPSKSGKSYEDRTNRSSHSSNTMEDIRKYLKYADG